MKQFREQKIIPYPQKAKISRIGKIVYAKGLGLGVQVGYLEKSKSPVVFFYSNQEVTIIGDPHILQSITLAAYCRLLLKSFRPE